MIFTDQGISDIPLDESPSVTGTWKWFPLWIDDNVLKKTCDRHRLGEIFWRFEVLNMDERVWRGDPLVG